MKKKERILKWFERNSLSYVDFLILCLVACVFYRTIYVSMVHDDLHCSYIFGMMKYYDDSFWKSIGGVFEHFITVNGRFFPLSMHQYAVYYLAFGNEILYKSYILIMVLINIIQFRQLIFRYVGSVFGARVGMLTVAGTIQYYISYHNGISGYHLFMQIMLFILICLINCLLDYRNTHSKKSLCAIVILVCIAILNYEIGYLYGLLSLVVIFFDRDGWKKKITNCIILGTSMSMLLVINFYVRMHNDVYAGTKPNFNIISIVSTFCKQCFGSLPFSYSFMKGVRNGFGTLVKTYIMQFDILDIVFLILFVVTLAAVLNNRKINNDNNQDEQNSALRRWWDILLWLGLYGSIGLLPALTEKYQKELVWGVAHISSYLQSYLLVFMGILCMNKIGQKLVAKKLTKISTIICAVWITLLFGMFAVKMQEIDIDKAYTDAEINSPRNLLKSAISRGLMSEIPDDSTIIVNGMTVWTTREFMAQYSGKRVSVIDEREVDETLDISGNVYYLDYSGYFEDGIVVLAKIDQIADVTKEKHLNILTSKTYLYLNDCQGSWVEYKYVDEEFFNGRSGYDMVVLDYDGKSMVMILQDIEYQRLFYVDSIAFRKGL